MVDVVEWPFCQLTPQQASANLVPFTRSGGRSLGGIETATRTDRGWWSIDYTGIPIMARHRDRWRTWQAIRTMLSGRAGLIAVGVPASVSAPYASGLFERSIETTHSDGASFSDGSHYWQGAISIKAEGAVAIGATQISLRIIHADANLAGVRFSHDHALYETGPVIDVDGDVWTLPVFPAVRATIPDGADLEFDRPTCLVRLANDRAMDIGHDLTRKAVFPSVSFVEAVDYWSNKASGLI